LGCIVEPLKLRKIIRQHRQDNGTALLENSSAIETVQNVIEPQSQMQKSQYQIQRIFQFQFQIEIRNTPTDHLLLA